MKFFTFLSVIIYSSILFANNSAAQMTWNQACSFSDSNYIAVPHSASLNITGSFTVEMWINPDSDSLTQALLQKRAAGADGYTVYLSAGKFAIRTNSSTRLISTDSIPKNQWTHVAGSYDFSTDIFRIFINGVLDTSTTFVSAVPVTNTDSVKIGVGFNQEFTGKIDEARIWNFARTFASDIQSIMRLSLGTNSGIYTGLVMSLSFQGANPAIAFFSLNDGTSNNNDAFNRGATSFSMFAVPSNTISVNECVSLSSTGDYLAGPDHSAVSPTSGVTVEAWVHPRSFDANTNVFSTIVHKGNSSGSVTDYRMAVNLRKFNFTVNEVLIFQLSTSGEFFPLNKWTHVAFTYSGSSGFMKFILNGDIRWDDTNFVGNIHNGSDSFYVGGTPALEGFDGNIDELRITSSSLSYGIIGNRVFTSLNESNDESGTNVVYNFDGGLVSNSDAGPELFLRGSAGFSHNAFLSNSPVSPLSNSTGLNFQKGFYISNPNFRIPESGSSGFMVSDTIDVPISDVISDVNVFVGLNHTDEDNLILSLISPSGTAVTLYSTSSLINSSDNIVTIFDDQHGSSLISNQYVMFTPVIKPLNNLNSSFAGTNTLGKWKLRIQDAGASDTGTLIGWGIQFNNQIKKKGVLSVDALIQGFYDSTTNLMVPDTLRAYVRNVIAPYSIFDSSKAVVNDSGKANFIFNNVPDGEPVFIQIKHRNSIETWSRYTASTFAILFEEFFNPYTSFLKYNFTNSTSSAFGNNLVKVDNSPNKFAIYGGDVNQDGAVNLTDMGPIFNDAILFASGYRITDLTGDNSVNLTDMLLAFNNNLNFVTRIVP